MSAQNCAAENSSGAPCGAYPITGSEFCYHHDPMLADEAHEARRLGGERRRHEATVIANFELPAVDDPQFFSRMAEIVIAETLPHPNSVRRNQLLKECWKLLYRRKVQDLSDRAARLQEEALWRQRTYRPSR